MQYTYRNLQSNHIRVLHLDVGASDEIHCRLSHENLDFLPTYEALSYRWADSRMTEITVQEEGQQQRLPVTISLFSALQNLRLAATGSTARTVWADALCINQDDPSEKSVQIQLMGEIYRKARRVITYIGDGDSYTQSAIAMAKKMMEWAQPRAPNFSPADKDQSYLNLCSHLGIDSIESVIECHPNPSVRSIQGMLDASWSMRVWILQESLLNDNVIMMCGRHEMPWTMLDELGALITQKKLPYVLKYNNIANTDKDAGSARTIRRMASLRRVFKSLALLDIINSTHHMLCSDPKDKIYGLYGVLNARNEAQHCARIEMEVSYQKSVADVYTETAIFLLSQPSGLGLFTSIGVEPNIQGLPSWVPDWSETLSKVFFLSRQQAYFASGRTQLVLSIDKQLKRITLSGARIDRVTHVTGEIMGTILNPDPVPDLPGQWAVDQLARVRSSGRYSDPIDAFWTTLIADAPRQETSAQALGRLLQMMNPLRVIKKVEKLSILGVEEPEPGNVSGQWMQNLLLRAMKRLFCMTDKGYCGIVPPRTCVGDTIAIVRGGRVPLVFRDCGGQDEVMLLGEAYIHGLMNGEAMDGHGFLGQHTDSRFIVI